MKFFSPPRQLWLQILITSMLLGSVQHALAQRAPAVCHTGLENAPDVPPLEDHEWSAVCNGSYSADLEARLVCLAPLRLGEQNPKDEFLGLRAKLCDKRVASSDAEKKRFAVLYRMNSDPLTAEAEKERSVAPDPVRKTSEDLKAQEEAVAVGAAAVVAQGVAQFLVNRAEATTSEFVSEEVLSSLCGKESKHLFPNLCKLRRDSTSRIGLGTMRSALIKDWQSLPESAIVFAITNASVPEKDKPLLCTLDVGYALMKGVREEKMLEPLLHYVEETEEVPGHIRLWDYRIDGLNCSQLWDPINTAASQFDGKDLQGKAKEVSITREGDRKDLAATLAAGMRGIDDEGMPLVNSDEAQAAFESYFTVLAEGQLITKPTDPDEHREKTIRAAFTFLRKAYEFAVPDPRPVKPELFDEIEELVVFSTSHDWSSFVVQIAQSDELARLLLCVPKKGEDLATCEIDTKLLSVLTLVADIAQAQTSDGVAEALDNFAAPVGTWKSKFDKVRFYLNGYAGLKAAYEVTNKVDGQGVTDGMVMNPFLALGPEVSWPLGRGSWRMGLFFPVIDVGNVASVRLSEQQSDDLLTVETAPDVEFVHLLSPGAFFLVSLGRSPFVLGVGATWTPELRKVENGSSVSATQVGDFLAVDVPLLGI